MFVKPIHASDSFNRCLHSNPFKTALAFLSRCPPRRMPRRHLNPDPRLALPVTLSSYRAQLLPFDLSHLSASSRFHVSSSPSPIYNSVSTFTRGMDNSRMTLAGPAWPFAEPGSKICLGLNTHSNTTFKFYNEELFTNAVTCYTGWLVTGGTSGKGVILREKRSRKYRVKIFRLRLCFRENRLWILARYACTLSRLIITDLTYA